MDTFAMAWMRSSMAGASIDLQERKVDEKLNSSKRSPERAKGLPYESTINTSNVLVHMLTIYTCVGRCQNKY